MNGDVPVATRSRYDVPMQTDLKDKVVLITGASGGIGQATARAFAEEDSTLALHYNTNAQAAENLCNEIGGNAIALRADLTKEADVDAMYDRIVQKSGRIDAIVVNAGTWTTGHTPVHEMSLKQWREIIDADLTSAFLTCRGFLRHLQDQPRDSASIVLVGSTAGIYGEEGDADYAAAKSGMIYGLMLSLKNELVRLAPRGRVNSVCPGWVDTPSTESARMKPGMIDRATATMALKKIATAEDCANAIVFLSSDRLAGHLTGVILPVSGGMEGRLIHPPTHTLT